MPRKLTKKRDPQAPTMRYLQRIGQSYYVRVRVPPSLQAAAGGATHIRKALHTRDLDVATRRKWSMVEAIKAGLERLRNRDPDRETAQTYREQLRKLREEGHHDQAEVIEDFAVEKASKIEQQTGNP